MNVVVVDVVVVVVVVDVNVVDVARDFVVKLRPDTKPVFYSISLNRNLKAVKPIQMTIKLLVTCY